MDNASRLGDVGARTIALQFFGVGQALDIEAKDLLAGKSNYYIGKNPRDWHVNIPQFGRVQFGSVYPGVDAVFYGTHGNLEFDLHVSAQAHSDQVRLRIAGADKVDIDSAGNLIVSVAGQELRLLQPTIYEEADGLRKRIAGGFVLAGRNEIGFSIAKHHLNSSLVIDPVLSYSTPLGLTGNVQGTVVDAAGNVYFTGWIPAAIGNGTNDVFISKLNSTGSAVVYTTVFGGSASDSGTAVAADSNGNAYVTGTTGSVDFPTTPGVFMSTCPSPCFQSPFLTKILANGTIGYSTYTGGSSTSAPTTALEL